MKTKKKMKMKMKMKKQHKTLIKIQFQKCLLLHLIQIIIWKNAIL